MLILYKIQLQMYCIDPCIREYEKQKYTFCRIYYTKYQRYEIAIVYLICITNTMSQLKLLAQKVGNKVVCVGKNYMKHIIEMGGKDLPKQPVIFLKPWSSLNFCPETLSLPMANKHKIEHEIQLGVVISKGGQNISKQTAMEHVGGYFLGLDLTDRTFQNIAKEKGWPWGLAKCQDNFCPISQMINQTKLNPYQIELQMVVNDKVRQKDSTANMHFKIDEVIAYVSQFIKFQEGDLILTGTPQGVGPLTHGDQVQARAKDSQNGNVLAELKFKVTE